MVVAAVERGLDSCTVWLKHNEASPFWCLAIRIRVPDWLQDLILGKLLITAMMQTPKVDGLKVVCQFNLMWSLTN